MFSKQGPAKRSIIIMANKSSFELASGWQLRDKVSVVFPDNGVLKNGRIVKVSFTTCGEEPRYDVEIPFSKSDFNDPGEPNAGAKGYFRIHDLPQWFLSYTQEEWDEMRKNEKNSNPKREDPTNYRLA